MTLEEAIKHCEEKACGNTECAAEHKQLAEWLKGLQAMKSLPSNLEEAAHSYSESDEPLYSPGHRFHWDGESLFGKQIETTFKAGAKWQKEQLMKEAVEWAVTTNLANRPIIYLDQLKGFQYGDKVRIIIVKEDAE